MLEDLSDKRDPKKVLAEFRPDIKSGRIKARTNHGVRLGMSPAQVRAVLGKPTRRLWSTRFNAYELVYSRITGSRAREDRVQYKNYYLFRNDKLFFVELREDALDGG
jgi:hypothetical protein